MAKRVIIFIFLAVFLSVFLLIYFFSNSAVLNILYPAKQFSKEKVNLHLYGDEEININKVVIKIYYCLPKDGREFNIENWQKILNKTATDVSEFYQLQFNYNMKMDFEIYPQIIYLNNSADYFTELVVQDLIKELVEPHSESQSMDAILNDVEDRMKDNREWKLRDKEADGSYVVNLFVLGIDINALQANGVRILGLNNESNNSLVFSTGFTNNELKDFYESVVSHEIGHSLGMPKFYSYSDDSVKSSGVMGGGFTRKLKDNYLQSQIKEKMIN